MDRHFVTQTCECDESVISKAEFAKHLAFIGKTLLDVEETLTLVKHNQLQMLKALGFITEAEQE